jgi:hypothetical protein
MSQITAELIRKYSLTNEAAQIVALNGRIVYDAWGQTIIFGTHRYRLGAVGT